MKITRTKLAFIAVVLLLMASCKENIETTTTGFEIEFSNGTVINENNILFYDSSTWILYLKDKVFIPVLTTDSVKPPITKFDLKVNDEIIYSGHLWPTISNMSPNQPYISSRTYPNFESDFMEIKHFKYMANNNRVIERLKTAGLLKYGISCRIDTVYVSSSCDSAVTCVLTLKNFDNIDYNIPDPEKMGVPRFINNCGGLGLTDEARNIYYWPNYKLHEIGELRLEDLSVLKANSSIAFSFTSKYKEILLKGNYIGRLRYESVGFLNPVNENLNQEDGRIWIGQIFVENHSIKF